MSEETTRPTRDAAPTADGERLAAPPALADRLDSVAEQLTEVYPEAASEGAREAFDGCLDELRGAATGVRELAPLNTIASGCRASAVTSRCRVKSRARRCPLQKRLFPSSRICTTWSGVKLVCSSRVE